MRSKRFVGGALLSIALALSLSIAGVNAFACDQEAHGQAKAEPALHGLELPNAKFPLPGVVSAGQPSAAQFEQAKQAGIKTVVNLRGPDEPGVAAEKALLERLGLRYVHIPITKGALEQGLSEENARKLAKIIAHAKEQPVLIHCASGNRVGALMALMAFYVEHKGLDEAIAFGRKAGLTGLERYVRRILEAHAGGGK